jgi:hypothetical protein
MTCWHAIAQDFLQFDFNLRNDGWRGGASIARFIFHSVPLIWIVARRDLNSAGRVAESHKKRKRGSGTSAVRKPHRRTGGRYGLCRGAGEAFGAETRVEANEYAASGLFRSHDVASDRMRDFANVVVRKVFGAHAAPSIRPKLNRSHLRAV